MNNKLLASHPFGTTVTPDALRQMFAPLRQWEDKYRQLIILGKQLPPLPDDLKHDEIAIAGCENRVWLGHTRQADGTLHFYGDSEGRIVKGLLAVLLTSVEGKTPRQLLEDDPLTLFAELGLLNQLSASRSSGLAALTQAVQQAARQI